jgi:uncharacterized repeat protein (TIGR03987 family)
MLNQTLVFGIIIVNIALVFYSIGIISEQKRKVIKKTTIVGLTLGILCDITATVFMIIGSRRIPLTFHGIIGYSALLAMLVDTVFIWRHRLRFGSGINVGRRLHLFSRYAYCWWVIAYIAGAITASIIKAR